jgi:SAM-dependent methyltransferase
LSTSPSANPHLDPTYPAWLEEWWTARACRVLGQVDFRHTQAPLEKAIQRLSDLFTRDRRTDFGDYGRDEKLLLAYGLFYFPQTFVRIRFPLREALFFRGWRPSGADRPLRLLDLGAGLGGATLGAATLLHDALENQPIEAIAVDQSTDSLATLRQLAAETGRHTPRLTLHTARGDLKTWFRKARPEDRWDIILASFSLGEAFFGADDAAVHTWIKTALGRLRPGGLLLITEPALKETSERIERLRNAIAQENTARILAPCPHHRDCPLLATRKFWCHEVRHWPVPESLDYLNRHLFRGIRELKFSYLMLAPAGPKAMPESRPAGFMRLISPMSDMKGRYTWTGCAGDGQRYEYEIHKRELDRNQETFLTRVERGDLLIVKSSESIGETLRRRVKSPHDLETWPQGPAREAAPSQ